MLNFFGKRTKKQSGLPKQAERRIEELEQEFARLSGELEEFKQAMRKAITKVGIVRYNAFGEGGGDQSFSIALLDENKDGLVVTSHYGREANRVYAKPIQQGTSPYALSEEEQRAMEQAEHDIAYDIPKRDNQRRNA